MTTTATECPPEEPHSNSSRYNPVHPKEHGKDFPKHNYCEHENEGMDTHTHTSRYVPAQKSDHKKKELKEAFDRLVS